MLEVVDRGAQEPLGPVLNVYDAAHLMTLCNIPQAFQSMTRPKKSIMKC